MMDSKTQGTSQEAMYQAMNILGNYPTTENQGAALKKAVEEGKTDYAKNLAQTFKKQLLENGVKEEDLSYM